MKKQWLIALCVSLCLLALAVVVEKWNQHVANTLPIDKIERTLWHKEQKADSTLNWLVQNSDSAAYDLWLKRCTDNDIVYLATSAENLIFWSSARLDVSTEQLHELANVREQYVLTDNAHCVVKSRSRGDSTFYAFIVVKMAYQSESLATNSVIRTDFELDDDVVVLSSLTPDSQAVCGQSGYLFSLQKESSSVHSTALLTLMLYLLAFVSIAFLVYNLDWLLGATFWSLKHFLSFVLVALLVVLAFLRLAWPEALFAQELFSPLYYASNSVVASLGHLLIISIFTLLCAAIFYFKVHIPFYRIKALKNGVLFSVGTLVIIGLQSAIFALIVNVVRNSSFDLAITRVENLSIYSVSALFAIFVWCLSAVLVCDKWLIRFKYGLKKYQIYSFETAVVFVLCVVAWLLGATHWHWYFAGSLLVVWAVTAVRLHTPRRWRFWQLAGVALLWCALLVVNVLTAENSFKREKYAVLAEKLANDADNNVDVYVLQMLETVDCDLQVDWKLRQALATNRLSPEELTQYIDETYFRSYWHDEYNYSLKAVAVNAYAPIAHRYDKQIADGLLRSCSEHFYANDMKSDSYRYLGVFDFKTWNGTKRLFISLYNNDDSEQNTLFSNQNRLNLSLSMAKYVGGVKVYNSGRYVYPMQVNKLSTDSATTYCYVNDFVHRIYRFENDVCVVVGERQPVPERATYLFFIYFYVASLLLLAVVHLATLLLHYKRKQKTLLMVIRRVFTSSSILILTLALFISVVVIYQQHSDNLLQRQTDRVRYAQVQMENYVATHSLDDVVELIFMVQDMSKLYRSDVNVYDASGTLVATSRPYLFSTGLFGNQMSPQVYFAHISKAICITEAMGDLSYLSAYAPVTNDAGNVVAYVGMPQLFSSRQLSRRLFNFLALFLSVYLLFLIIATFLGHFVGARIMRPLHLIGQKMRATKLGANNEKIAYSGAESDEIGLLVGEYNAMVDKLDESAQLLARSERESAWRDMARQISHEIRNPLTPMKLTIQQLQRLKYSNGEEFDSRFQKYSQMFVEQIDSMAQMAANFSKFAQVPTANPTEVELNERLQQAVDLFSHNNANVEVVYMPPSKPVCAFVDAEHITLLLNNLLQNAIQAIPSNRSGRIELTLTTDEQNAIITISDNGCGLSDEAREKLFMPNFTTKSSGMGLGLYLVQNIVKLANGTISFESEIDKGTTFKVLLPLVKK